MPHSLLKTSIPSTTTTKGKNSRSTASQLTLLTGPHPAQCQPRLPHHHCLPLTPFKNQQTQLSGALHMLYHKSAPSDFTPVLPPNMLLSTSFTRLIPTQP